MGDGGAGARTGDHIRARTADRDALAVEGVLHLRHIPAKDYVQVRLINDDGGFFVDPSSVEVIERSVVPVEELERSDPVVGEPGWRRMTDLDAVRRDGLVHEVVRGGGTWSDLFARLEQMIAPLLQAGWSVVDRNQDQSAEFGDSVFCTIQRGATYTQFEMYEDGELMLWPLDENSSSEQGVPLTGIAQVTDELLAKALDEVT